MSLIANVIALDADELAALLAQQQRAYNREALGCNDKDRSVAAMKGIVGKRLTYQQSYAHALTN